MTLPDMHDSGQRESFSTGAVRDTAEGKPRPDLISPHANGREGAWLAKGAEKYKERNWEAGINISRCIASLSRHLNAYKLGKTDEDHMAAIRTNAGFILHYEEEIKAGRMDPTIDDMPKYVQIEGSDVPEEEETRVTESPVTCPRCGGLLPQVEEWALCDCPACGWTPYSVADPIVQSTTEPTRAEQPTFYIAGPMRGHENLNFPAFDRAAECGRQRGYSIISPADLDREHGIDPVKDPGVTEHENILSPAELREIVKRDIAVISSLHAERRDGIAVLDGWENSVGARAEVALARWLGLQVVLAEDFQTEIKNG